MIKKIIKKSFVISTSCIIISSYSHAVFVEYDTNETEHSITIRFQQDTVNEKQQEKINNKRAIFLKSNVKNVEYDIIKWLSHTSLPYINSLKFFGSGPCKLIIEWLGNGNKINKNTVMTQDPPSSLPLLWSLPEPIQPRPVAPDVLENDDRNSRNHVRENDDSDEEDPYATIKEKLIENETI
jgi:hypothetical protein